MNRVKASFDSLPIAVSFFDSKGIIRLVNHRMLAVMDYLHRNGVQTLAEMDAALKNPPENVECLSTKLGIYRFPGGKTFRFAREEIATETGTKYTQVTAADVTEILHRQLELKEENAKLAEANERLRKLFEQMPEIIREEETLAMKLRVHDDIGHSILTARRTLLREPALEDLRASAKIWEEAIAVLYRSNQMREEADTPEQAIGNELDPLDLAISKAGEMGVKVLMEQKSLGAAGDGLSMSSAGKSTALPLSRELIALAINECASNCVRHADGTEIYITFDGKGGCEEVVLTNNGMPPKDEIREGGGLSMLRQRVEEAGGRMEIESQPNFKLILTLPKQEVTDQ